MGTIQLNLNLSGALPAFQSYQVPKTGLPFYDACVLLGAMHYFFGSSACSLQDRGSHYLIEGSFLGRDILNYQERLKGAGLERIEATTLVLLENLESKAAESEIEAYFQGQGSLGEETVSRYLEPAFLSGARGYDAARYSTLASEQGLSFKRPRAEVWIAALGLTRCSLVYSPEETLLLMPILEGSDLPQSPHLPTKEVRHPYPMVGALHSALEIQEDASFPIHDFAVAYHGARGFYRSGLLGLPRVPEALKEQALEFLGYKGDLADLGESLANFLVNPSLKALEELLSIKASAMANPKLSQHSRSRAAALLKGAVKEVWAMCKTHGEVPPSPHLVTALAQVLAEDPKHYFVLANTSSAQAFYQKLTQLLARQIAMAQSQGHRKWSTELLTKVAGATTPEVLAATSQTKGFAAHKVRFLLGALSQEQP